MRDDVHLQCEPLDHSTWIDDGESNHHARRWWPSYPKTVASLKAELHKLGAEAAVIELDLRRGDLRMDGWPKARASVRSPRVRFSFHAPDIGHQSFSSDRFKTWKENLHGIYLTIQRLRLIEEYGATRGQQQYRGYQALPASTCEFRTKEDAARFLVATTGAVQGEITANMTIQRIIRDAGYREGWYRAAALAAHPDKGGGPGVMERVNAARALLGT